MTGRANNRLKLTARGMLGADAELRARRSLAAALDDTKQRGVIRWQDSGGFLRFETKQDAASAGTRSRRSRISVDEKTTRLSDLLRR